MCGDCAKKNRNTDITQMRVSEVRDHTTCEGITLELLTIWKRKFDAVREHSFYQQTGLSQQEVNETITLLGNWMNAKMINPGSCEYFEKLANTQHQVSKIMKAKLGI